MVLNNIIKGIETIEIIGDAKRAVTKLCLDSRLVEANACFFAVNGTVSDGHDFIESAVKKGASTVVCEHLPKILDKNVTYVKVKDSAKAMGYCASNFYGNPSQKLQLVGITGTNGKTTTVTLLHKLFCQLGYKVGLLSTIQNKINNDILESTHTTPDAIQLNQILAKMVEEGCTHAFMEVSSHAISQQRIAGVEYTGAVFSNITHDHLDYHKTFDAYIKAKKTFFDNLPETAFALTNIDDKNGLVMLQNTKAQQYTYSIRQMADFRCKIIENSFSGLHLQVEGTDVYCRLVGKFNAYNFMAAYGVALLLGKEKQNVLTILSNLDAAEGRFEHIRSDKGIVAIVDYAHTPDALDNVLSTIADVRDGAETLITVVGCGGDRDAAKRPVMARIATQKSEKVILTSDNPRTEDPQSIIDQMFDGIEVSDRSRVLCIVNRESAIQTACMLARKDDIILVSGKGHEKYQEINGVKHHFDDKEILEKYLN